MTTNNEMTAFRTGGGLQGRRVAFDTRPDGLRLEGVILGYRQINEFGDVAYIIETESGTRYDIPLERIVSTYPMP